MNSNQSRFKNSVNKALYANKEAAEGMEQYLLPAGIGALGGYLLTGNRKDKIKNAILGALLAAGAKKGYNAFTEVPSSAEAYTPPRANGSFTQQFINLKLQLAEAQEQAKAGIAISQDRLADLNRQAQAIGIGPADVQKALIPGAPAPKAPAVPAKTRIEQAPRFGPRNPQAELVKIRKDNISGPVAAATNVITQMPGALLQTGLDYARYPGDLFGNALDRTKQLYHSAGKVVKSVDDARTFVGDSVGNGVTGLFLGTKNNKWIKNPHNIQEDIERNAAEQAMRKRQAEEEANKVH